MQVSYLNVLIASGFTAFTIYLICVRVKHIPAADKYKGTPSYGLYKKIYSPRFLVIAIANTLLILLGLAYQIFSSLLGPPPFFVEMLSFIMQLGVYIVLVYLLVLLFRKK